MDKIAAILKENAPQDELGFIIREASASVERDLALEDSGWISLSGTSGEVITAQERVANVKLSRLYAVKDPLGKQAIRLWTDYTFGSSGIVLSAPEDFKQTKKVLEAFWKNPANKAVLSARGQRKNSDKLLIDGEVFFAIFLGPKGEEKVRLIDPLEIVEIITNPEDKDEVRFYRRDWTDPQSKPHATYYRDWTNVKGKSAKDSLGADIKHNSEALIYHLTQNTTTQRGNPLLLPALLWMKYHSKFLASRIAIMLALAKFAWRQKTKGGQAQVDAIKAKTNTKEVEAGSTVVENLGVDTTPIKTESGASAAYQDGRMLKLMICSAVGIPEQYFGDIATGNLATAKTVELPLMKMFQSYQDVWSETYRDINNIVLAHNSVPENKWYTDIDLPPISPLDAAGAAEGLVKVLTALPALKGSKDVLQTALMTLGIDDTDKVLEELEKLADEEGSGEEGPEPSPEVEAIRALKRYRESLVSLPVSQGHHTSNAGNIVRTIKDYEGKADW